MAHICHDLRRFSTLVGSRALLCEVIEIAIRGYAKSVVQLFNTKELIHEWYIHLQMRIVCVGWKAPCLKKSFCTLSLSSYQSPILIVDNQGVAQRAHPNRRERWILKCTKLRQGICLANNWFTYWILPHPICLPPKGHDDDCRLRSMKHRVAQLLIWIILSYIIFVHLWPWYHLWFSMINPAEVKQDLKTVASGGKRKVYQSHGLKWSLPKTIRHVGEMVFTTNAILKIALGL